MYKQQIAPKPIYLIYVILFFVIYGLNCLTPLSYGDDYLYSFVWDTSINCGNMYRPISEGATRVGSFYELFRSLWSHYFTWGGRIPAHFFAQFFLWQGKTVFNIMNTLAFLLLLLEISWISLKGRITLNIPVKRFLWIFFAVWTFTPDFSPTTLWLTGACNYLWMMVITLAFLLPWIQFHYRTNTNELSNAYGNLKRLDEHSVLDAHPYLTAIFFLFFGILTGWTNENTICWLIPVLLLVIIRKAKSGSVPFRMISGWIGLCIGYTLMMMAPGNFARLAVEASMTSSTKAEALQHNILVFALILLLQFILWYFIVRAVGMLRKSNSTCKKPKSISIIYSFIFLSMASLSLMLLSPAFPARAGFGSSIFLITACATTLQFGKELGLRYFSAPVKKILYSLGCAYVILTIYSSACELYALNAYTRYVDEKAMQAAGTDREVVVFSREKTGPSFFLLELRRLDINLNKDPAHWANTAYSRYYGIHSIRVVDRTE